MRMRSKPCAASSPASPPTSRREMLRNRDAAHDRLTQGLPALVWQRRIADTLTPVGAACALMEDGRGDFLLESVEGGEIRGR